MPILDQQRINGASPQVDACSSARAILERAIATAPSNISPPRGLRRLFARDQSAAGLIKRYGLWPAMEHTYELVSRKFGIADLLLSAEDDYGQPYLRMELIVRIEEPDLALQDDIQETIDQFLRPGEFLRLSVFISGDTDAEVDV